MVLPYITKMYNWKFVHQVALLACVAQAVLKLVAYTSAFSQHVGENWARTGGGKKRGRVLLLGHLWDVPLTLSCTWMVDSALKCFDTKCGLLAVAMKSCELVRPILSLAPFFLFAGDPDAARREAVKKKTAEYLRRAEEIFQQHLKHLHLWGVASKAFPVGTCQRGVPCWVAATAAFRRDQPAPSAATAFFLGLTGQNFIFPCCTVCGWRV